MTTSTIEKAETLTVGTLKPPDLVAALSAVIVHASTNRTYPGINGVKFEAKDGTLTLVATDRYTLGTFRLPWNGPEFSFLLGLAEAKELHAFAKKAEFEVSLNFDGTRNVEAWDFARRTSLPTSDAEFPRWAPLIPEIDAGRTDGITGFLVNPANLAKFVKAADMGEHLTVTLGSTPYKPIRIDVGDHFTGLVMPVRASN